MLAPVAAKRRPQRLQQPRAEFRVHRKTHHRHQEKGGHGGHHGGAWKVAYADFVTALMALFIVLWLLNTSQKVQEAVGGYFRDPSGTAKMAGSSMQGVEENFVITKDNMEELKEQLQKTIREVPVFDKLKNNIDMTVTNEGLRIELTESATGTFFDSGSAKISGDGSELVVALAEEFGKAAEYAGDGRAHGFQAVSSRQQLRKLGAFLRSRQRRASPDDPARHPPRPGHPSPRFRGPKIAQERRSARSLESPNLPDGAIPQESSQPRRGHTANRSQAWRKRPTRRGQAGSRRPSPRRQTRCGASEKITPPPPPLASLLS
jgi:hypothetical protein